MNFQGLDRERKNFLKSSKFCEKRLSRKSESESFGKKGESGVYETGSKKGESGVYETGSKKGESGVYETDSPVLIQSTLFDVSYIEHLLLSFD